MNFAFALFRYFPFGGLQRDMLRMAQCAAGRGHHVTVFTAKWEGEEPVSPNIQIELADCPAWSNHGRARQFEELFIRRASAFDVRFVFNRMRGGDFYFAADNCLAVEIPRRHSRLMMALNPRYRTFLQQERAVLAPPSQTRIFYITPRQKEDYIRTYRTEEERFIFLPPGMNPACRRPEDADSRRAKIRQQLGLSPSQIMLILVGSDFYRKGGDRAVTALAALPPQWRERCMLYLVGRTDPAPCRKLAHRLGLANQVTFTGGRTDVPDLLLAADLMIHPARDEATGTVLIEAVAAGLPVLCTQECGFSNYVHDASGFVVPEGASQDILNTVLAEALPHLPEAALRTRNYADTADFYRRADTAVDALEQFVKSR